MRRAAIVILRKLNEEKERLQQIVASAREKGGRLKDINPEKPDEVGIESDVEEWIIISWELEREIIEKNIDLVEKWVIEDDFDY